MSSSTLPSLLSNYLPGYKEKEASILSRFDEPAPISGQLEHVGKSNEVEKKPKRTSMAHRRQAEAVEKASKEKEEKALRTFKMWTLVKENEHKRKQRRLKDRVNLQHLMIKKQDELIKEKQQREKESLQTQRQNAQAMSRRQQLQLLNPPVLVQHKNKPSTKPKQKIARKPKTKTLCDEQEREEAPQLDTWDNEEKLSQVSKTDVISEEHILDLLDNSTVENADFRELRYQPLEAQLEALFGGDADGYLNPTLKESPRKTFDLSIARKKGQHGAAALWETLRAHSRQKLLNKDALILPDVKNAYTCFVRECLRRHITPVKRNFVSEQETPVNVNIEESDVLKNVKYRRHRQDLMYRIAHINRDKTRLLFQVVGPPHYVDEKDEDGIRRYYPEITQGENEEKPPLQVALPNNLHKPRLGNTTTSKTVSITEKHEKEHKSSWDSKLIFLTEKKATCRGQFTRRLNKGVKEGPLLNQSVAAVIPNSETDNTTAFSQRIWEPLSMQALLDHQVSVLERRK